MTSSFNGSQEKSAGGVIYRRNGSEVEVCLIRPKETKRWQLPKGHIEAGEETADAALRETEEETGLNGELGSFIDAIEYAFTDRYGQEGKGLIHKQVSFYLVRAVGGSLTEVDATEIQCAQWMEANEALTQLSFENERRILRHALKLLGPEQDV